MFYYNNNNYYYYYYYYYYDCIDTSRPPRTGEVNGQHYFFATKEEMKQKIFSNQFVEHGEFGGHYYGLSINTVRSVINQGKIALISIVPRVSCNVQNNIHL